MKKFGGISGILSFLAGMGFIDQGLAKKLGEIGNAVESVSKMFMDIYGSLQQNSSSIILGLTALWIGYALGKDILKVMASRLSQTLSSPSAKK